MVFFFFGLHFGSIAVFSRFSFLSLFIGVLFCPVTGVLLVTIAVLLHVSILVVLFVFLHMFILVLLLSFYRCRFWQYRSLFIGVAFGSIDVSLQVIFVSITIFFTCVLLCSKAVFLQVSFLEVSLSWKTFVTCQVVS